MSKGIDIQIDRLLAKFNSDLWASYNPSFYGRIFRNEENGDVNPERYIGNGDYEDVLLSDFKSALCFFDVQPTEEYSSQFTSEVWICFAVNLETLYPSVTERATEYAHEDVLKLIKRIGGWNVTGLVRGLPAFNDYSRVKDGDNMQPFYLFRFNCEVKYTKNC